MCAQPWCWAEQSSRDTRRVHTAVGGRPCASARHLSSVCVCVCVWRRRRRGESDGKRKVCLACGVCHELMCAPEKKRGE